ncbi:hypothetical protein EJ02DRAFT_93657 [Clathrospora elynae]|uniref:Rpr2-domain-containing protein n=1 Tax=Clathrospora elynae TaxID=706981 RepID=A0A6A5SXM2_9PLEO|nr:hypothetical protein EJ02DRAFT_93657 [Clathrospora elynae]
MAQADQNELRARFLQEAAHLLAISSPVTSAFLGSARNRLIEDTEIEVPSKETDAFRREICGACGNVMIPGWSCKTSSRTPSIGPRTKEKNGTKEPTKLDKSIAYACLRCHRETVQTLQPKPRRQVRKTKTRVGPQPPAVLHTRESREEVDNIVPKTANAGSKERRKARKGGLQAMLAKNKTQMSGLGGLDLMDFAM